MITQEIADAITWSVIILLVLITISAIIYFKFLKKTPPPPITVVLPPGAPPAPLTPPAPQPAPPPKKAEPEKELGLTQILWMFLVGGLLALGIAILRFKEILGFENVSLPIEIDIGVLVGVLVVLIGFVTPKQWGAVKIGVLVLGIFILAVCAGFSEGALAQMQKSFHIPGGGASYTPRTFDGDPVVYVELVDGGDYTAEDNQWTLWTKSTGMCPALLDPSGIEILESGTEYLFRSYSGTRTTTGYNLQRGEHVPGYPEAKC